MQVTVRDIADLNILKRATIQTGTDRLEERIVEWVSVIETPVENFVRKNEFVLTTGIGCGEDEQALYEFVEAVINSEAAALAVAIGKYIDEIPYSVEQLAKKHHFPIILLPWEVRFADVIQSVVQALDSENIRMKEKSKNDQQKLLNLILRGGGLDEVANFLFKENGYPVVIVDKRGFIKGRSKRSKNLISDWEDYLHSEDFPISMTPLDFHQTIAAQNMRFITMKEHKVLQLVIQTSSEVQGHLLVGNVDEEDADILLNPSFVHMLEHAVTAVALCFLRENTIRETEMRLRDDFVWGLAKGDIHSWDSVMSRARTLGYNVSLPFVCLVAQPENMKKIYKRLEEQTAFEHWLSSMVRTLEDEMFYAARSIYSHIMTTFQREQFIIFLEAKQETGNETVYRFLDHFEKRLQQIFPELVFSWGVSKTIGMQQFHESYQEAQTAIEIGKKQKGKGHKSWYADSRLDRALMTLMQNDDLQKITSATLGTLLTYDAERGIDLIQTYLTYSKHRGNVSQTSRELNLHRQSLLYRLRKIESLTGCSLNDTDDIFLLDLSIRLWTLGILESN
ncbi:PucR family transcriptional regulator ligand-binding domain-containing protein [Bacillus tianshenii]|nr:PucR family transcriptional regulator ligand-binding domain-containing protein [Bacillus tianshenii]